MAGLKVTWWSCTKNQWLTGTIHAVSRKFNYAIVYGDCISPGVFILSLDNLTII